MKCDYFVSQNHQIHQVSFVNAVVDQSRSVGLAVSVRFFMAIVASLTWTMVPNAAATKLALGQSSSQHSATMNTAVGTNEFSKKQQDGYLVVAVALAEDNAAHEGFRAVADRVKQFHSAELFAFDGENFAKLKTAIAQARPRNVLFVIPPECLDVNFQRQVFFMSPTLDSDLAADFAWGY